MRRVFFNPELNNGFLKKGYVVLDLMSPNTCDEARLAFEKMHKSQKIDKFFTTTNSLDASFRQLCNDYISSLLEPLVRKVVDNYKPLYSNFMIKPPVVDSICDLHQDWTFVDESRFRSINVWVALQDTDISNGCIHVIAGSQNIMFPVRGRNISRVFENAITSMTEHLMTPVPLKKGQCVIFDSAIFHYSPVNTSMDTRIAMSIMLYPADAPLFHYVYSKQNPQQVKKYPVDPEFFLELAADEDFDTDSGETLTIDWQEVSFDFIKSELAKHGS